MSAAACWKCGSAQGLRECSPITLTRYPERTHICHNCALGNLENGLGMKILRTGDGCEWNPAENRPAYTEDEHAKTTPAAVLVGANGNWRLCADCANLPRFARYRTRKPIGAARA